MRTQIALSIGFLYILWRLILWFGYNGLPVSGSVQAKLEPGEYGFGPSKQLVMLDITNIGSVANIDESDKAHARMSWSDIDNPIEWKDIGLEIKGSGLTERKKLNYDIELWEDKDENTTCLSPDTCDDRKEKIFQFSEKYEDFILRGSAEDPTFVREVFPFEAEGGILEHTLVEVLIKNGDTYYYEGVYIMLTKIGRRVLEKRLHWEDDLGFEGKAENCDDDDYDIDHTALIAEFTNDIGTRLSKHPCPLFVDYSIKMRYPKCEDYDDPAWASCRQEYVDRTNHFVSAIVDKNTTEVSIDLDSFVKKYYFEKLWNKHDWASEYVYVTPNSTLSNGPRWDYDDVAYWNALNKYTFDLTYNFAAPPAIWSRLGKSDEFIRRVKEQKSIIDTNKQIFDDLIVERRSQKDYFDRNNQRWDVFNKRYRPFDPSFVYFGPAIKSTFEKQLDDFQDKIDKRNRWLKDNIDRLKRFTYGSDAWKMILLAVLLDVTPLILLLLGLYRFFPSRPEYVRIKTSN